MSGPGLSLLLFGFGLGIDCTGRGCTDCDGRGVGETVGRESEAPMGLDGVGGGDGRGSGVLRLRCAIRQAGASLLRGERDSVPQKGRPGTRDRAVSVFGVTVLMSPAAGDV